MSLYLVVPTGYLKTRQIVESKHISDVVTSERKHDSGCEKIGRNLLDFEESMSPLDRFIMLRTGILSPEIAESGTKHDQRNAGIHACKLEAHRMSVPCKCTAEETELQTESKEVQESWVNSPTVQDVYLNSNTDTHTERILTVYCYCSFRRISSNPKQDCLLWDSSNGVSTSTWSAFFKRIVQ